MFEKVRKVYMNLKYKVIYSNRYDVVCSVAHKLGCFLRLAGARKAGNKVMKFYDKHVHKSNGYLDFYCS